MLCERDFARPGQPLAGKFGESTWQPALQLPGNGQTNAAAAITLKNSNDWCAVPCPVRCAPVRVLQE
jgi:hypothetical protein